jgi:hypothetical protein
MRWFAEPKILTRRLMGIYQKGMAVFTVAKGGLMFSASIAGQKFTYSPRSAN